MKLHFTGVVNTTHGLFQKAFLQESLSSAHARSRAHLISTVDCVKPVSTRYKFTRRKVLFLISTVGNHNQSREHELAMEEAWLTQDCWFRLATTLAGICVTDCWKLVKFHVSARAFLKLLL
jgi:hypothetical protein